MLSTGVSARVDEVNWSVTGLLGREAGTMLAERLLGPLLSLEPERRDPLLSVLRGWLTENGSWDASAKLLGLHRNSVRRQIGVIAELLDMDLNAAQVRAGCGSPCSMWRSRHRAPPRFPRGSLCKSFSAPNLGGFGT